MRALDDLKDLKREYLSLVRTYGEEATDFKASEQSLLDLNRRHRLEAVKMYADAISRIEKRMAKRK